MKRVKVYLLTLVALLFLSTTNKTDTKEHPGCRQSQDDINLCDIDCLCEVSPICWNSMKSCPQTVQEMTVLTEPPAGGENLVSDSGFVDDNYIEDPENGFVEDYYIESPVDGYIEDYNIIVGLESLPIGHKEGDGFSPNTGSTKEGSTEIGQDLRHQESPNSIEDIAVPDEDGPTNGIEETYFDPNQQSPETSTTDKDSVVRDTGSIARKRRDAQRELEIGVNQSKSGTFETICRYPMIYREPLQVDFSDRFRHTMLRMITACQDSFVGSVLQSKCYDFKNTTNLETVIPVTDRATGRIFANRYCAECNGLHDYEIFIDQLICNDKLFEDWKHLSMDRTHDNQITLIKLGLCVYYFTPPNKTIADIPENKCFAVTYKHCNRTGDKFIRGAHIWNLCGAKDWFQNDNTCSLCDEIPYPTNALIYNRLLRLCDKRCKEDFANIMSVSFFALISLERTQMQTIDVLGLGNGDQKCQESGGVYDKYTKLCRPVLCPVFHVKQGKYCKLVNSGLLDSIPKIATVLFHELNKTDKGHDPFENFEEDTLLIIEKKILLDLFELGDISVTHEPELDVVASVKIFWKFYKKQGEYNGDFIIEFAWRPGDGDDFIPDIFVQLFKTTNVRLPIAHTSSCYEARSVTSIIPHGDNITVDGSVYTLVFHKEYKEEVMQHRLKWVDENSRFIPMARLLTCKRVSLSLSEYTETDGVLYHPSGITIPLPDDYIITGYAIEMCADNYFDKVTIVSTVHAPDTTDKTWHDTVVTLSFACSCISIICLLITIVTYLLLKPLRTVPGKINLCLCLALLMAQTLQQFTMDLVEYRFACIIFGVFIHFTWSASLLWMNVSSFNLFICFSTPNVRRHDFQPKLTLYSFYVICISSLFVAINVGYTFLSSGTIGYGENLCYISTKMGLLISFVIPVGVIVLANLVFLSVTVWKISHSPRLEGSKTTDRNNVLIYIKMSTLTGICWIFGFLRILTMLEVFEVLFILANASQGLFIMISFICNRRVITLLKEILPMSKAKGPEPVD